MKPHALALGLLLVFAVLTIGGAAGSPQPDSVCRACGTSFAQAAEDSGYNVSVVNSTATVRIHENGTATWTVTNRLDGADADSLAAPGAAESVAREAVSDGHGLPHVYEEGDLSVESVAVDDRSVTIRFTDPDAGTRRLGTLVVDYFHSDGVHGGWILDVDEFTLVGPPNVTVVNDPAAAIDSEHAPPEATPTVEEGRVTWHGSTESEHRSVFYEDLYVVYGESGTADWRVTSATTLSAAPIWIGNVSKFVVPTALLYGAAVAVVLAVVNGALRAEPDTRRIAAAIAGLGSVALIAAIAISANRGFASVSNAVWLLGIGALYLVAGAGAVHSPGLLRSGRGSATLGLVAIVGVAAGYAGLSLLTGDEITVATAITPALFHLPVAVGLILGAGLARYRTDGGVRPVAAATGLAVAAFLVAGGVYVPFDSSLFGLVLILLGTGALAGAVAATPLVLLAASAVSPTRTQ